MKVLNQIDSKFVVAIDIETVRVKEHYSELSEDEQVAWSYKNKSEGQILDYEELDKLWNTASALYAEFSKVCAVSLVFMDAEGQSLMCKSFYGSDEKVLLTDLLAFLNRISSANPQYRLIGHAANFFDYNFICKRCIINGLDIPKILDDSDKKPWEKLNLDTNDLWKMGSRTGSSLVALCSCLGLQISKGELTGEDVGKHYYEGNLKGISEYCSADTICCFNIFRKFKKESVFTFEDVHYIDGAKAPVKEMSVLEKLYAGSELTDEIKAELAELIKSKKPTKKDKESLKKIIAAHYLTKKDKVNEKKVKEAEITEFIDNL